MSIQENTNGIAAIVPRATVKTADNSPAKQRFSGPNLFMMTCCAAMAVGTAIFFAAVPAGPSLGETLLLAAPVLGCLGMHIVMHRLMGKSCHSATKQDQKND